jgi:uncharacterized lipoprotein
MNKKITAAALAVSLILSACATSKEKKDPAQPATSEDDAPSLTKPKVRSFVVPDTIEGNKYIKSHRVYILEDPGAWSR